LKTAQIAGLTTDNLAALTTTQITAIETVDIQALTTKQLAGMSTAAIVALTTDQIVALKTSQLVGMSTTNLAALTTDQIVALNTTQVRGLTTANLAALTTTQITALETTDIRALRTNQIAGLTTTNLAALTTDQLTALTTTQVESLTGTQWPTLTTTQISHLTLGTPLVLDLNGDGVKTQSISAGVKFDLFANGQAINTGWVSSGDGLLVLDRNQDGQINDGSELFGSTTTLASGAKASDGYAALGELDSNHDGVISSTDTAYADLRVWVDANSDGVSEAGELKSLDSLDIAKISLNASVNVSTDSGNLIGLTSTYETADGATHAAADVWFVADKTQVAATVASVDVAIASLNGTVVVRDGGTIIEAATSGPTDFGALQTDEQVPSPVSPTIDLRSRVSSMAQAIGSFGDSRVSGDAQSSPGLHSSGDVIDLSASTALAVASMATVMKQFDSNGNLVGNAAPTTAAFSTALKLPGIQDPLASGFLATGK
jgi:hypothetical protein